MLTINNIFKAVPKQLPEELFETLLRNQQLHIERIVSRGHTTPDGQWYDQAWDEWVILLQGQAKLRYAQDNTCIDLQAGDHLLIPAHTQHRVEWTLPNEDSIWLAVHVFNAS